MALPRCPWPPARPLLVPTGTARAWAHRIGRRWAWLGQVGTDRSFDSQVNCYSLGLILACRRAEFRRINGWRARCAWRRWHLVWGAGGAVNVPSGPTFQSRHGRNVQPRAASVDCSALVWLCVWEAQAGLPDGGGAKNDQSEWRSKPWLCKPAGPSAADEVGAQTLAQAAVWSQLLLVSDPQFNTSKS